MLAKVKTALRVTDTAYDAEIQLLIDSALLDLGIAGVDNTLTYDALLIRAVITYCRMNFGSPADYDRLKLSYDEQKAQMQTATGYGFGGDCHNA